LTKFIPKPDKDSWKS